MHQPRGARGGERSRRQYFYIHQDYCIQQAWRKYQYNLDRQDFRQLDAAGNQRYINGVAQVFETYGADWSQLCAEVPALAAVVPVAKGGNKGRGKGKGKPAEPKQAGKGQGQQEAPGLANPKAKPQAIPKADPKLPAAGAPPPKARDTPGTPAVAKATPLGGGESGSGASSSGGLPVAAPKAEGAAPPAEPKSDAPEPAPAASGESDAPESAPAAPDTEEKAPEPTAEEPAPLTAAEVLPKEEPELGEVKEEPGEEEQKAEEVVKEEAPDDEIDAGAAEAPAVDTVADAAPDDIDTGAAEAPDVDCVEAGDGDGAGPEEPEDAELEAAEDPEGGTDVPIDVDEEEAVHSSPAPEAAVDFVHSPASPDFSERAFSEPPERPQPEGRLRTRPRILRPPSDLPPGTYPTVRLDRQGLWILVSPNPGLPATSGVRDAEQLDAPDPTEGAAPTTEHIDPYELSQEQWVDLASVFAKAPASIDLSTAPVVSARRGERTVEGFRAGVGAFAKGEVIEARSPSPARSRSPRAAAGGAAPSAPSKATSIPAPPAKAPIPKPPCAQTSRRHLHFQCHRLRGRRRPPRHRRTRRLQRRPRCHHHSGRKSKRREGKQRPRQKKEVQAQRLRGRTLTKAPTQKGLPIGPEAQQSRRTKHHPLGFWFLSLPRPSSSQPPLRGSRLTKSVLCRQRRRHRRGSKRRSEQEKRLQPKPACQQRPGWWGSDPHLVWCSTGTRRWISATIATGFGILGLCLCWGISSAITDPWCSACLVSLAADTVLRTHRQRREGTTPSPSRTHWGAASGRPLHCGRQQRDCEGEPPHRVQSGSRDTARWKGQVHRGTPRRRTSGAQRVPRKPARGPRIRPRSK